VKRKWLVCVVALVSLVTSGWCDDPKADKADQKAILGTWLPSSAELAGKPYPENIVKSIRLVLSEGKYVVTVGNNPDEGTWKIDPTKTPRTLEITGTKGPNKGKTIPAIYELTGDTLRVCYDLSGKATPTAFESKPETKLFLVTYKRHKP
jgi:uncharacterized protein (TIGR03067 family)